MVGILGLNPLVFANTIYGVANIPNHRATNFPAYVQMGSFTKKDNAQSLVRKIQSKKFQNVKIKSEHNYYKVIVGPFKNTQHLMSFYYAFNGLKIAPVRPRQVSLRNEKNVHPLSISGKKSPTQAMLNEIHHDMPKWKPTIVKTDKPTPPPALKQRPLVSPLNGITSRWYLNGQVGGQFANINSSTTVNNGSGFASPNDQDLYSAQPKDGALLLGIGAGKRYELTHEWMKAVSLGLQYQYFYESNISGQVTEFSLPEFENYSYEWPLGSNLILANAKFNFRDYKQFSPYFSVGLGGVIQENSGYTEAAYSGVTARISPNYANNNSSRFAYILGVGLDYPIDNHMIFSAGYQYSDLGQIKSGYGQGSWSNERLSFGNYTSNAFVFSATYLFDQENTHFKLLEK